MKRTKQLKKILLLVLVISSSTIHAQDTEVVSDLQQWTSIDITKKLNKKWSLSFEQEVRFKQDISNFDVYFADLGLSYKLNKHMKLGANYRFYQNKNNKGVFQTQHRWNTDFQYKQKISRFTMAYRLRFQNKDEDFYTSDTENNLYNLRNKFSIDYNIKGFKLDPFFDVELYRQIEDASTSELSKLRYTLGVEYPLKKFGDIKLFYRIDNELNLDYDNKTYIIGVGYKFSF